jgi:hypothetical protein
VHEAIDAAHTVLGVVAATAGEDPCVAAAGQHGPEQAAEQVGRWLYWTARQCVLPLSLPADVTVAAPPVRVPHFTGPVRVDPEVPPLGPLAGLLADTARQRGITVVVRLADLHTADGHHVDQALLELVGPAGVELHAGATLLELRRGLEGAAFQQAWSHECAHVLDPGRPWADRETFADALGPLLLRHQPATLEQARPLIDQAEQTIAEASAMTAPDRATPPGWPDHPDLPAPGPESLIVFCSLPLGELV